MSTSIKQCLAFFLVVLCLLVPIFHLFKLVSKTEQKVDTLQQNQSFNYEKTASELKQMTADLKKSMTGIENALQKCNDSQNILESLYRDNQTHDHYTIIIIDSQSVETEPTQSTTQSTIRPTAPHQSHDGVYYGRLCIPDANIDVGLYYGADQAICDREDSANIFTTSVFDGLYIADHNNQEFSKLSKVTVGMRGYLKLADGAVFNIICTEVLTGHNTGKRITDENGNINFDADYLMYTCRDNSKNVLICLWKHN